MRCDEPDRLLLVERRLRSRDQRVVERAHEAVVLRFRQAPGDLGRHLRLVEHAREVEPPRLPVLDARAHVEQVGAADHFLERAEAQLRHDFAHFLGDEEEKIDDVLGLAGEFAAQHRVLRRDADRARVEMALAHHDAAFDDQRRRREAEFVRAEHRADGDVAAGLHLAVDLHGDASAQPVQHQRLLRFREAQFPRRARVHERRQRRGARAAVMAGDGHVIGLGLGDTRGDRAHADLRHELHRDRRLRVGVLQVVDQLRQILDRIDVVVRRRRDEAHAGHRIAQLRDVFGHLVARQLAALAGLGALRHLDLDLVGRRQVFRRDAEARRGHLLDLRAQAVAVLERNVALDASRPRTVASVSPSLHAGLARAQFGAVARRRPRRPRRCSTCRRCGSSPPRASRALRWRSSPGSSRPSRSG